MQIIMMAESCCQEIMEYKEMSIAMKERITRAPARVFNAIGKHELKKR